MQLAGMEFLSRSGYYMTDKTGKNCRYAKGQRHASLYSNVIPEQIDKIKFPFLQINAI